MDFLPLAIPAFIAGILMFLAPCTLPLVPGYLSFISGVPLKDLDKGTVPSGLRARVLYNGLGFVIGFSLIFIALGLAAGFGGAQLVMYRAVLAQIGGALVILFGLFMLHVIDIPFLQREARLQLPASNASRSDAGWPRLFKPGNPLNAGILGATFALGWTPCIGPILGTILLFASTTATAGQGAVLLAIFSLGLAVPFLLVAAATGAAMHLIARFRGTLTVINVIGGIFLITLGVLMLFNESGILIQYGYKWFSFIGYERLLDYL